MQNKGGDIQDKGNIKCQANTFHQYIFFIIKKRKIVKKIYIIYLSLVLINTRRIIKEEKVWKQESRMCMNILEVNKIDRDGKVLN